MKRTAPRARALFVVSTIWITGFATLQAQTAPATSTAAPSRDMDETIEMSPFVVTAAEDTGYQSTNTLAGTRIKTELKDVGAAVSVVTKKFLTDTGARNSEDLLVYTANTEVGGIGGNFTGNGTGTNYINTDRERVAPQQNTRVRGLTSADFTRDLFLTSIPWDSYNVERIDMQRGPNSILFGLGSPAGIVNSSPNIAMFRSAGSAEFRYGSYGSRRGSLDLNQVLLTNELAVRVDALYDHTYYQQEPAFNLDKRRYGALRYDPRQLNRGTARTSFRLNYEYGDINANRPRVTPPVDAITPWFTALNKQTYDARTIGRGPTTAQLADPTFGAAATNDANGNANPNYQPWLDGPMARIYDGAITAFQDPTSGEHTLYITGERGPKPPAGFPWYTIRGIQPYNVYAVKANLPGQRFGVYNPKTLQDPSIFDYYNQLIDGPNKSEWQHWESYNGALSQTFANNSFGVELVYDRQKYGEGQTNFLATNNGQVLTVDVIRFLPDGSENPNVGRPLVASDSANNNRRLTDRESLRATAFGEIRAEQFMDRSSLLAKILGRHRVVGLYSEDSHDQKFLAWMRYAEDENGPAPAVSITAAGRSVVAASYLGPTLLNASSASGAHISNIKAAQMPGDGQIRLFDYTPRAGVTNPNPLNDSDYVGWYTTNLGIWSADAGDIDRLYTNASTMQRDEVDSRALVWQGFMFDGTVVPTIGWRRDKARNYNAGSPPVTAISQALVNDPTWRLPAGPDDLALNRSYNDATGESTSWSVVMHTPRQWREKMPVNVSLFYNESDNFRPDASRRDLFGTPVAAATGETQDFGVVVGAFDDKITLKVNWYDTKVRNVTLTQDLLPNFYLIGAGEAWGYGFATWARKGPTANAYGTPGASAFGQNYNLDTTTSDPNDLIDPTINPDQGGWLAYQPAPGQSIADAYRQQTEAIDAFLANPPPAAFLTNWGMTLNPATSDWGNMTPWSQPGGVVVTGDTLSKGVEFELTGAITDNWTVTLNASKTKATRQNLAKSYSDWIEGRYEFYQGPAGNVRLWGGAYGGETVRSKFEAETYGPYALFTKLAQGSQAPEIRPWRFNVVTNYTFTEGRMKGVNVGASYRWQDKVIVGYPFANNTWDISRPYKGPSLNNVDLWLGYERKLTERIGWRVQLNVKNAFADTDLIPITVEPDGSMATGRIPEDTIWTLTNTFTF